MAHSGEVDWVGDRGGLSRLMARHVRRRETKNRVLGSALSFGLVFAGVGVARAQEVIVHTTDGRAIRGEMVQESEGGVRIAVAGIATDLPRSQIAEIVRLPDEAAGFAARRAAIDDNDLPGRVDITAEMIAAGLLDSAALEIDALRETFPESDFPDALMGLLESARPIETVEGQADDIPGFSDPPVRVDRGDLLSDEAIAQIKIGEMDLEGEDRRLAIHIPAAVMNELFDRHAGRGDVPELSAEQSRLRRADASVQWRLLESTQDMALMSRVHIIGDPVALRSFRQEINPRYVWRYFGRHFGRGAVNGLELVLQKPNGTPEAYTNFKRLSAFRTADAAMVDRLFPSQSLLLQWGLPRDVADHPAPEVPDWRPYFRGRDDPRFLRMRDWIEALSNTPEYLAPTLPAFDSGPDRTPEADQADPQEGAQDGTQEAEGASDRDSGLILPSQ